MELINIIMSVLQDFSKKQTRPPRKSPRKSALMVDICAKWLAGCVGFCFVFCAIYTKFSWYFLGLRFGCGSVRLTTAAHFLCPFTLSALPAGACRCAALSFFGVFGMSFCVCTCYGSMAPSPAVRGTLAGTPLRTTRPCLRRRALSKA